MSYITDIRDIFLNLYPSGSFLFASEVRADDSARNINSFPLFVIDDLPLITTSQINEDAGAQDSPSLKIYVLTKRGNADREISENNSTRLEQHEECVDPMKTIAMRVMGIYFREGKNVLRRNDLRPQFIINDRYNLWSKMLYGVEMQVRNLQLRRMIDYCNQQLTFNASDIPGVDINENYVPTGEEEMIE